MENNNQDIKLCPSCGARNKAVYKFCNECGAILNQSDYTNSANNAHHTYANAGQQNQYGGTNGSYYGTEQSQNGYTGNYMPYGVWANAPYMGVPDFDGVSAKDVYEFSGEKPEFFEKLKTQHFSGRNTPYCWPLFILGILLGFFGMGCWYLYHKMYKPAVGLFAAAAAQISFSLFYVMYIMGQIFNEGNIQNLEKFLEENPQSADQLPMDIFSSIGFNTIILEGVSNLLSIVVLALTIALPFFAYKQYKNFALNKIRLEYTKGFQPNLRRSGGTASGLVVLASILYGFSMIVVFVSIVVGSVTAILQTSGEYADDVNIYEHFEHTPFSDGEFDFNNNFD